MIVIKIGGSLIRSSRLLVKRLVEYAETTEKTMVIVPGGSVFADTVRAVHRNFDVSEESAHWMAILGMEQYGYYLADGTGAEIVRDLDMIKCGTGHLSIILPYDLIRRYDELEHSWKITSDTIAAWIANRLGAGFLKATDVDGIYMDGKYVEKIKATELIGTRTCVDAGLPSYLHQNKLNCIVVNGNCPGNVISVIEGRPVGTLIEG